MKLDLRAPPKKSFHGDVLSSSVYGIHKTKRLILVSETFWKNLVVLRHRRFTETYKNSLHSIAFPHRMALNFL
jgi:hypothetical protein